MAISLINEVIFTNKDKRSCFYALETFVFILSDFFLFFNLCLFIFILLFFTVLLSQIASFTSTDCSVCRLTTEVSSARLQAADT